MVRETLSLSKLKLGILISGRGSNMAAIIDACEANEIDAEVAIVISNNANAKGLALAHKKGIPTKYVEPNDFDTQAEYETVLISLIEKYQVSLICLAGYMKILGNTFIDQFKNKIINIHPSLLPSFKGLNAQQQALDYGVQFTGCTVHFVEKDVDSGPIILQDIVEVKANDTQESLSDRLIKKEHQLYPKAIQWVIRNKIKG